MKLKSFLAELRDDERGTSSIELGLICVMIVIAMFAALKGFASSSVSMWNRVNTESQAAIQASNA